MTWFDKKRNPMDFRAVETSKGEPELAVSMGRRSSGLASEKCSAMNCKQLGNHFDIHGGGFGPDVVSRTMKRNRAVHLCAMTGA